MADQNAFNLENYTQGQIIYSGNEQILQFEAQIFNQNESQIEPSTYFQEENVLLKETVGIEGVIENGDLFNYTNTLQDNTMYTNTNFGYTLKTETEIHEYLGQGTTKAIDTKEVEGNNFIGNTSYQIQVNENNYDTNAFLTNINDNTKEIFEQVQPIQATTTTESNTFFNQAQKIDPQFGKTQILPTTESTQFFDKNAQDFAQIQIITSTLRYEGNTYEPYKLAGTSDIDTLDYGTIQTQKGFNISPTNITQSPLLFFPLGGSITQTQTTITKTVRQQNQILEPVFPYISQTYENLDYEQYPTTRTQILQPQKDINQFHQVLETIDFKNLKSNFILKKYLIILEKVNIWKL